MFLGLYISATTTYHKCHCVLHRSDNARHQMRAGVNETTSEKKTPNRKMGKQIQLNALRGTFAIVCARFVCGVIRLWNRSWMSWVVNSYSDVYWNATMEYQRIWASSKSVRNMSHSDLNDLRFGAFVWFFVHSERTSECFRVKQCRTHSIWPYFLLISLSRARQFATVFLQLHCTEDGPATAHRTLFGSKQIGLSMTLADDVFHHITRYQFKLIGIIIGWINNNQIMFS